MEESHSKISMTEHHSCDFCEREFDVSDNYVSHLVKKHNIPKGKINMKYETPTLPPTQNQSHQQMENGIRPLLENPEETEKLISTIFDRWSQMNQNGFKHQQRMIFVVGGLFTVVLLAASSLAFVGTLQGSAYTLLLGTMIGYLLTFLEDYI